MNQEKNGDKGFKVTDRRFESISENERKKKDETIDKEQKKSEGTFEEEQKEKPPLPEVNFTNFILSLSTSVLLNFGDIPDPVSKEKKKDLNMAKQTIDIIGMLQEKTKGNLNKEEESLIESLLYDLRMRYVKESSQ
ncbi:MAG TPA: DUF1844 domain-containing protein [Nitrospinota bacterium]|nr:DUF1844 domain-containing protein [Nitrospinota bacterium]